MTTSRRFYMDAARRVTRDLIVNNPVRPDVFNEYEAVQGWPLVTALNRSSSQQTTGLVSWRYILIEGPEQVPPMSLWTMHEIWDAVCCRIRKGSGKNDCFRLRKRLARQHWSIATGRALRYDEQLDDLNRWAASRDGDLVAAWIDLLGRVHALRVSWMRARVMNARKMTSSLS